MLTQLRHSFALTMAVLECARTAAATDDANLTSHASFDPSTIVREAPRTLGPRIVTGLTITPVFDGSITRDADGAGIMNAINAAIGELEAQITDPITVVVKFKKTS